MALTPLCENICSIDTVFTGLSRFTGRSSELRSPRASEGGGTKGWSEENAGRVSARRNARVGETRSIPTMGRRHRESLLQCEALICYPRSSRARHATPACRSTQDTWTGAGAISSPCPFPSAPPISARKVTSC